MLVPPLLQVLQHLHGYALNDAVLNDDVFHGVVFRVQADNAILRLRVKAFQGSFVFHEGYDDLSFLCGGLLPDQDKVTVVDACLDHGVAVCPQKVEAASAE